MITGFYGCFFTVPYLILSDFDLGLLHLWDIRSSLICCHSWSAGVIMYTLLAGSPPFWHRKQMLMLRMILTGNYQFTSPEWDDRSDTVKDLVCNELFKGEQDASHTHMLYSDFVP